MIKKIIRFFLFIFLILAIIAIYSRYGATTKFVTNEISIKDEIEKSYNGLKIIHFGDLHYGRIITKEEINKVIKEINLTKPDIVVFTGDLLDKDKKITEEEKNYLIKELSKINSKYGNYAILGNHDYSKEEEVINIFNNSNFTLLNNNYDIIYNENNDPIFIGGVGSSIKDDADIKTTMEYFNNNKMNMYKIILIHEPDYIDTILEQYSDINLVLAGHSHLGQLRLPGYGALIKKEGYLKYSDNYYEINNTKLYITNGLGVSHYNFRLFNTPSINLYRINKTA